MSPSRSLTSTDGRFRRPGPTSLPILLRSLRSAPSSTDAGRPQATSRHPSDPNGHGAAPPRAFPPVRPGAVRLVDHVQPLLRVRHGQVVGIVYVLVLRGHGVRDLMRASGPVRHPDGVIETPARRPDLIK